MLHLMLGLIIASSMPAFAQGPKCIAHRGLGAAHLENSSSAIEWSMHSGVHGVEFDVLHTRDGVGILMHDKTLERTAESRPGKECPLKNKISELFWHDIKLACRLKNAEEIPTLAQVLQQLQSARSDFYRFVELKDIPSQQSLDLLQQYAGSPAWRLLAFDKKALTKSDGLGITSFFLYPLFIFPTNDYGINAHYLMPSLKRFKKYKDREIGVWTVNKPNKILTAMLAGADFVTTNESNYCMQVRKAWDDLYPSLTAIP